MNSTLPRRALDSRPARADKGGAQGPALRRHAGRASGAELLGHAGFTIVLIAGSAAALTGAV